MDKTYHYRQPSTDTYYSYDTVSTEMSHSSYPMYAERVPPGQYPPFRGAYPSTDQAKNRLYGRRGEDARPANSIMDYRRDFMHYAKQIYNSMLNLQNLREANSIPYRNLVESKVDYRDIEATATMIVDALIKRHQFGAQHRFSRVPVADRNLSIEDRFEAIVEALKVDKLICQDAYKGGRVEYIVHAPLEALKTKKQNKAINRERETVLEAGLRMLGKQTKRTPRSKSNPRQRSSPARTTDQVSPFHETHQTRHYPPLIHDDEPFDFNLHTDLPSIANTMRDLSSSRTLSGSSTGSGFYRSTRPPSINTGRATQPTSAYEPPIDPALKTGDFLPAQESKTAECRPALEPEVQTGLFYSPTHGGIFTARGTNINPNYNWGPVGSGFTPTSQTSFEPLRQFDPAAGQQDDDSYLN